MIGLLQAIEGEKTPPFRVLITGDNSVYIEGVTALVGYEVEAVSVRAGKKLLAVRGSGLTLTEMDRGELTVSGKILSVEVL